MGGSLPLAVFFGVVAVITPCRCRIRYPSGKQDREANNTGYNYRRCPSSLYFWHSVLRSKTSGMSASGHYESIKPYPRKPPFTTNPEKSHIYVSDTPARNGTAAPYVFGNSQEFERHIAATPRPSTRVVYVTLQSGAESVAY